MKSNQRERRTGEKRATIDYHQTRNVKKAREMEREERQRDEIHLKGKKCLKKTRRETIKRSEKPK